MNPGRQHSKLLSSQSSRYPLHILIRSFASCPIANTLFRDNWYGVLNTPLDEWNKGPRYQQTITITIPGAQIGSGLDDEEEARAWSRLKNQARSNSLQKTQNRDQNVGRLGIDSTR